MLKKTLKLAGIGFLIGIVIGDLIAFLTGNSDTGGVTFASKELLETAGGNGALAMVMQSLFSGLYGAACFAGMSFYEVERMPLAAATALHCGIIVLLFIPIALLLGWVNNIFTLLIITCIQIIIFFIIWLSLYFAYKRQIKELNEMQKGFNKKDK